MLDRKGMPAQPVSSSRRERTARPSLYRAAFAGAFALSALAAEGAARAETADLTVDVSGLRNYKGSVVLMLWADSEANSSFPDPAKVQFRDERTGDVPCDFSLPVICRRTIESLQNLTVSYTFKDVPVGDYAAFVFHDENNNGTFDRGLFHRPLEGRGYSNVLPQDLNPLGARVTYHRARFTVPVSKTIVIGLRYPPQF